MNFAVVDIEVVNDSVTSIATIGVIGVDRDEIVEETEFYTKPIPFYFDENMTAINGLKKEKFENTATFDEIWDDLSALLVKYDFCVAHNASFDFGILQGCCKKYNLIFEKFPVVDSLTYARNSDLNVSNHKLDTLCDYLGIELVNHHNALDDALATAKIMLKLIEINKDNILDLFLKSDVRFATDYKARTKVGLSNFDSKKFQKSYNHNWSIHAKDVEAADIKFCENNLLCGKKVVISGELNSMGREKAYSILKACGAEPCDNITLNTNYLVTNAENETGKIKKAMTYIERGIDIKIISENEFLRILEEAHGTN